MPIGSAATDDDHDVRGIQDREGGAVASRRKRVEGQFLVRLEPESAVDDGVVGQRARCPEYCRDPGGAELGPALGHRDAGQHAQARAQLPTERRESGGVQPRSPA